MATRDSQRNRVFDAELAFAASRNVPLTVDQVRTLAARITRSQWFQKQHPNFAQITVLGGGKPSPSIRHDRRDCRQSTTSTSIGSPGLNRVWSFNSDNLNAVVLLHELAHHLQPADVVLHGPEYCKTMLECVRKWISPDAKRALLATYRQHSVKTKVYTPEAKARLSETAAKARSRLVTEDLQSLLTELSGEKPVRGSAHLFQPRKPQDP